jgi:hypothetical protein
MTALDVEELVADLLEIAADVKVANYIRRCARSSADALTSLQARVERLEGAHATMRPRVFPDGNMWCALYGDNLQDGVAGFGETPAKACADFDKNWAHQTLRAKGSTP